ncbi:MAG TPA: efflux RND transporter periplasmic adaptor subunit [Atribacterota bacterium]|nr:efflux RND transporter periplasmic adaptor subunit [Atribacterota bacterium]
MTKKKYLLWILIIVIIGVSLYLLRDNLPISIPIPGFFRALDENGANKIDPNAVIQVRRGSIKKTVSTNGYIKPVNEVYLSFATTGTAGGTVEKIMIKRGEMVEKGQELVKLEDKQEHLNYLKTKNEYELAKITGSPTQVEEKELTMEVARDRYESKTLRAPFTGKIVDIFVEEGDFIEGTHDVVYLIDDSAYEVTASISEVDCLEVEVGQKVEINLDIMKDQVFHGTVTEVAEYARMEGGVVTVPVTLRMNEVSAFFKPGFSATAEIIVKLADNALLVPITALSTGGNGSVVLKVDGDNASPVPVQTGITDGFYQEITGGLQEGSYIIVNNYQMNNNSQSRRGGFGGMGGAGPIPMFR